MDRKDRKWVNISSVSYLIYFQNKIVKTPIELSKRDFYSQQLQNIHQEFADTHMNPCNKGQNLTKHSDSLLVTLWYSGQNHWIDLDINQSLNTHNWKLCYEVNYFESIDF